MLFLEQLIETERNFNATLAMVTELERSLDALTRYLHFRDRSQLFGLRNEPPMAMSVVVVVVVVVCRCCCCCWGSRFQIFKVL